MSWRSGYGHTGRVFDVKLSPAGNCLLSASEDGSARVWSLDSETITQKACAAGHTAEVMHMRASWKHDQTMIATGSADTTAMIWRLQEEYASKCIAVLEGHAEELYCCEWVRNSEHVVTASGSDIMLWDISRQRRIAQAMLRSPSVHKDTPDLWKDLSIFSCAQHPSAALLASACSDGNVHVTSLHNDALQPVAALPAAEALGAATMCSAATFSPDGRLLAVGTRCNAVLIYCTRTWKLLDMLRPARAAAAPGHPLGITSCVWECQVPRYPLTQHIQALLSPS